VSWANFASSWPNYQLSSAYLHLHRAAQHTHLFGRLQAGPTDQDFHRAHSANCEAGPSVSPYAISLPRIASAPLLSICLSTPLTRGPRLSGSSPRCRCNRNADYLAGNLVPRARARSSLLGYKSGIVVSSSSPDPALFRPVIPTAKSSSAMPLPFAQIRSRASPSDCALQ
jgi:hypothetical protein